MTNKGTEETGLFGNFCGTVVSSGVSAWANFYRFYGNKHLDERCCDESGEEEKKSITKFYLATGVCSLQVIDRNSIMVGLNGHLILLEFQEERKVSFSVSLKRVLRGHKKGSYIFGMDHYPSKDLLLTGSSNKIYLWKLSDIRQQNEQTGREVLERSVEVFDVYDRHSQSLVENMSLRPLSPMVVYAVKFLRTNSSSTAALGTSDGQIQIFDYEKGKVKTLKDCHKGESIRVIDYDEKRNLIVSCANDSDIWDVVGKSSIKFFDPRKKDIVKTIVCETLLHSVCFLKGEDQVVSGGMFEGIGRGCSIYWHDLRKFDLKKKWRAHEDSVRRIMMMGKNYIGSCSSDGSVKIWNCAKDMKLECKMRERSDSALWALSYIPEFREKLDDTSIADLKDRVKWMTQELLFSSQNKTGIVLQIRIQNFGKCVILTTTKCLFGKHESSFW